MFKKYKRKILFSVAFGALVFLAISIYADFSKLLVAFEQFNWWWFPVILFLAFLNYIFRFLKWQIYLKELKIKVPVMRSFLIFLSSFVMSVTPGKLGEILKSYLLKEENGTEVSKSMPIVFAERLTDFISIVLLSIIGAFVFNYGQAVIIIIGTFFISVTLLLGFKTPCHALINFLCKIKFIGKHKEKLLTAYDSIYIMVKPKPLIITVLISMAAWFFECIGLYIVLEVFAASTGIQVNLLVATFIYGFSTLIGAIAMLPGGLGATEASMTGLLVYLKIPSNVSAASTIIIRVATLWFAVLVGAIAVFVYEKVTHHSVFNSENES